MPFNDGLAAGDELLDWDMLRAFRPPTHGLGHRQSVWPNRSKTAATSG